MSTPPWQPDFHQINGDEDLAGSMSIWDGEDFTLDMVTEAEDENVDEEVSILNDASLSTNVNRHPVSRRPQGALVSTHEEASSLQATPRTGTGSYSGSTLRITG
jgi:hypothetical protein